MKRFLRLFRRRRICPMYLARAKGPLNPGSTPARDYSVYLRNDEAAWMRMGKTVRMRWDEELPSLLRKQAA